MWDGVKAMESKVECYYILLDLHGPESTYQPLYDILKELRAEKLEGGFPVWVFYGEPDSHDLYRAKFEPVLPPWSVYRPDIRYAFLLMSWRGYTSCGRYEPAAS